MKKTFNKAKTLYDLEGYEFFEVPGHDGGRNTVYICLKDGERKGVLRISLLDDRSEEDFLAETEFVKYLADEGAPVADVIKSVTENSLNVLRKTDRPHMPYSLNMQRECCFMITVTSIVRELLSKSISITWERLSEAYIVSPRYISRSISASHILTSTTWITLIS